MYVHKRMTYPRLKKNKIDHDSIPETASVSPLLIFPPACDVGRTRSSSSTSRNSCRDLVHLGATEEFIYLLVLLWFVAVFVILD